MRVVSIGKFNTVKHSAVAKNNEQNYVEKKFPSTMLCFIDKDSGEIKKW